MAKRRGELNSRVSIRLAALIAVIQKIHAYPASAIHAERDRPVSAQITSDSELGCGHGSGLALQH